MLTFTTLASGSSGNAALVSCGNTHVLLDAGISAKRITAGLKSLGIAPEALAAVLITHEHHDHISGLQVLTKRFRLPVVASGPTGRQLCYRVPFMDDLIRQQEPGTGIQLGDLWIESFPTPHDAAGSVGYSITGGGHRMVLAALAVESGTRQVALAHLSAENNTPSRARQTVCRRLSAMGCDPERDIALWVAPRSEMGPVCQMNREEAVLC